MIRLLAFSALGFAARSGLQFSGLAMLSVGTFACQVQVDEADLEAVGRIEACDGMTLDELMNARTISAKCKASLEAYLPKPDTNFSSKLVMLGSQEEDDGSLTVYAHGVDTEGKALDISAWQGIEVSFEGSERAQAVTSDEFTVQLVTSAPSELLSIGIVNDYSGSMGEQDLKTVATIEEDLFSYVPPIFEAEVTQFSTEVVVKQPFTDDEDSLRGAVAYDPDFDRDLTALYDGMGTALDSLLTRSRPLRLLVVATDGMENESKHYTRAQLLTTISEEQVPVVMLGALFADPDDLQELAGPRGVFFYTPYYTDAREQVEQYLQSLSQLVAIHIPADQRGAGAPSLSRESEGQ